MASSGSGPRLLEDDFQFILCEGCRQESPNLKLLACLHTFCLDCLSKNKVIGQCPVCQTAIPQASGISDMDNLLFTSLQARLKVYKKIVDGVDLFCDNCKKAGEFWCSECEEFLCTKCFEAHQRYLKRESHKAKRVMDIRAGPAKEFLEGSRRTGNLSCSNPTHKNQTVSIYCNKCCKPVCCICALLDSQHAPFCDIHSETQRRQEELGTMNQELKQKRSGFEATYAALQDEAARLEEAQREMRELIGQRVEQLVRLIRQEEEELLGLVEAWQEQGRRELARELQHVEGVLRRMEAGERLVEKMRLYATEQEVMDMQPFIKDSLEELQRLQTSTAGDRAQSGKFAECRARLQALVDRVMGHPEAAPALAMENSHQISTSTPAKRKKVQNANVLTSPVKVVKVENNDDGWNQTVPQQPSCSAQLGTSCSVSPMTLAKEDSLLEDVPDGNSGLHDSDSDILCLDSFEDDSTDEESMDSSLLGDLSNILDEETSKDYLGLPISSQNTLDTRQGSLVFFDVKILKNESIQMTVVDGEKIFPVLIQPMKYLSSLMAKNSVYEIGLRNLLCHLSTVHRPILGGFGLWSLPFPTLLNALTVMNKKEEFSSVVYGFLDILPLIKEEIPKRDNYKLKNLASTYLWWHFGDCSSMENANMVKYLCEVLDVDLVKKPRLILSQANLESFISLQPLLAEKLLTKPSAQTLAAHNIGLSELRSCYQHNPEKGLQKACRLINTCRHSTEKKVQNLSKVKVYFQRQEKSAESQKTPAGSDFPGAVKNEEEC
ncbi:protein PML-like isoform X1 [Aquila chrysaetos chrysaetos]|uniref:protein PML-like isoform X1 n=1 Tax=Aquila chrysaetos chrysaetos TaxID=223781 RepID=UPI00117717E7|nr:protein PML-like isoform X1 [Aquila chrysaetos chrysaetos]